MHLTFLSLQHEGLDNRTDNSQPLHLWSLSLIDGKEGELHWNLLWFPNFLIFASHTLLAWTQLSHLYLPLLLFPAPDHLWETSAYVSSRKVTNLESGKLGSALTSHLFQVMSLLLRGRWLIFFKLRILGNIRSNNESVPFIWEGCPRLTYLTAKYAWFPPFNLGSLFWGGFDFLKCLLLQLSGRWGSIFQVWREVAWGVAGSPISSPLLAGHLTFLCPRQLSKTALQRGCLPVFIGGGSFLIWEVPTHWVWRAQRLGWVEGNCHRELPILY